MTSLPRVVQARVHMTNGPAYLDDIKKQLQADGRVWRRGDKILAAFGYVRRRQTFVDQVNRELEKRSLYTKPPITPDMSVDGYTTFYLKPAEGTDEPDEEPGEPPPDEVAEEEKAKLAQPPPVDRANPADLSLTVSNLECAERMPLCVKPDTSVAAALTEMQMRDYSQLVVAASPRSVRGIVSYRSIARAQLHGSPARVSDCQDDSVPQVGLDEPLLDVISQFQRHNCVLLFAADGQLCGIVTPADIAAEFRNMAGPFLVIGEIEEHLRWLIERCGIDLSSALAGPSSAAGNRAAARTADLTMGEIERIFQNPGHWATVGLSYDRVTFCSELGAIREFRNALMHFREPISADGLERLRNFAGMLRTACTAIARRPHPQDRSSACCLPSLSLASQ